MVTVLVGGAIANKWFSGGSIWTRLSYLLGLKKLGYHVVFVEQIAPESCCDPDGNKSSFADSVNLSVFREVVDQFGLGGAAALLCGDDRDAIHGMNFSDLSHIIQETDVLINISGHLKLESPLGDIRCKVFIDQDPGFTQIWHAAGDQGAQLLGYDHYFTVGENIGTPHCEIPLAGIDWRPTRQPLVMEYWPAMPPETLDRFTTVASWRGSFGRVVHAGHSYGLKVHEFRKFLELPKRSPYDYEIALDIHPGDFGDLQALHEHGWTTVDPRRVAVDPDAFRNYVQTSGAEFSVAQGIYLETNSGWFSDRTVRYLASGKPVLVQDTGFSRNYPVGRGLLTFRTLDDAVAGADAIGKDYSSHCQAARAIAEDFFDSDLVLGRLMEEVGFPV